MPPGPHEQPSRRSPTPELDDFPAYSRLADTLIERTSKEQLADVARLLDLNCGWCQSSS